jgi:predicted PurR-regulated permease PerM
MPMLADNIRSLHASLTITALFIAALVLGADLLIPLAIATILSFILNPIVKKLVRWRIPRSLAVAIVLGGSFFATLALMAVLSAQMLSLTAGLQTYRENLVEKARWVSSLGQGTGTLQKASDAVEAIDEAIRQEFDDPTKQMGGAAGGITTTPQQQAPTKPNTNPADGAANQPTSMTSILDKVSGPGTTFALTLLFTMFLLLQYEDIRDRVIRLAGIDNLSGTTAAMSDAGSRLSKLFLTQAVLNVGFGIVTGIVLAIIGVPNPILWGVVSAIARFIPYVGSFLAAVPPTILAAGVDPGWGTALTTAAFFVIAEPLMGHIVEPAILGRTIGLSPFAMVISASFWVLIWGPIGLLLAAPLTMLAVVLGAYVPRLEFVSILLGDQRALEPHLDLYRRILSGDTAAAIAQVESEIEDSGINAAVDTSLLPALRHAAADQRIGRIDEVRRREISETVTDVIEYLTETVPASPAVAGKAQRILVVPARGPFDELTAKVAAAVLDKSPRIDADAATGSSGLSAIALHQSGDKAAPIDSILIVTAGGMDRRLLLILARRIAQQFADTRVNVLESGEPVMPPQPQNLPEGVSVWRTVSEAVAALDFEPTRDMEKVPTRSPAATATATAA